MFLEFLNQSEPHIFFVHVLILMPTWWRSLWNHPGWSLALAVMLFTNDVADLFPEVCWSYTSVVLWPSLCNWPCRGCWCNRALWSVHSRQQRCVLLPWRCIMQCFAAVLLFCSYLQILMFFVSAELRPPEGHLSVLSLWGLSLHNAFSSP